MSYPSIINNCSTSTNLRACDWNVTPMKINSLIYIDNIDIIVQQIKILIFKIVFLILKNLILCAKSQRYMYMYHTTPWRNHIVHTFAWLLKMLVKLPLLFQMILLLMLVAQHQYMQPQDPKFLPGVEINQGCYGKMKVPTNIHTLKASAVEGFQGAAT